MNLAKLFTKRIKVQENGVSGQGAPYEYCTYCDADLTKQKGFDNSLPYWVCRGCGKMMINPSNPDDSDIVWICDKCEEMLNDQKGFRDDCGVWKCTKCGYENKISPEEIYASEDEYRSELRNPYKGMPDEDVVRLLGYEEIENICGKDNILLIRNPETGEFFVKKILSTYNAEIYKFLTEHPIDHMPRLYEVCEGENYLVIVEEYVKGITLAERIAHGKMEQKEAVRIVRSICRILDALHSLEKPIVHRDVKPSNVMLTDDGEVYLLDINVAKWINPEQNEDTKLMGTVHYAAPEQFGYGFSASGEKSDIYAVGMILNEMITGHLPKEEKAEGTVWKVIGKCIRFDPENRYTAKGLIEALERLGE